MEVTSTMPIISLVTTIPGLPPQLVQEMTLLAPVMLPILLSAPPTGASQLIVALAVSEISFLHMASLALLHLVITT